MYNVIELPSQDDLRPLAFAYNYGDHDFTFLMPPRSQQFWAYRTNTESCFFDNCIDCFALHTYACEGGYNALKRTCFLGKNLVQETVAGMFQLPFHIFTVSFGDITHPHIHFFDGNDGTPRILPMRIGNVDSDGRFCLGSLKMPNCGNMLRLSNYITRVFSGVFNGDYSLSSQGPFEWLIDFSLEKQSRVRKLDFEQLSDTFGKTIPLSPIYQEGFPRATHVLVVRGELSSSAMTTLKGISGTPWDTFGFIRYEDGRWNLANAAGNALPVTDDENLTFLNNKYRGNYGDI